MNTELLLHPKTSDQLRSISDNPRQGYAFLGPDGSGRFEAARSVALELTGNQPALIYVIQPDNGLISIEAIHSLRPFVAKAVPHGSRRVILIDEADDLSLEAQNSMLKMLEEPPGSTVFILVAQASNSLLPTVNSRLAKLWFYRLPEEEVCRWFEQKTGLSRDVSMAYYYVGGQTPGGMWKAFEQRLETDSLLGSAKSFLEADPTERIKIIGILQKYDRGQLAKWLGVVLTILTSAMHGRIRLGDVVSTKQLAGQLRLVLSLQKQVGQAVNTRLILAQLVLEL